KMFESIAAGIPPICTPHPQCVEILREFDCGVLLQDWSREALIRALREAQSIFATPRYAELAANCRKAVDQALNWGDQFAALQPLLPSPASLRGNGPVLTEATMATRPTRSPGESRDTLVRRRRV